MSNLKKEYGNPPKVSAIIPIYNSEKYLKKCVDSIISQTLDDIEIILVDDGSPDSSARICDEYAINESRIKVIHKENGGPSSARNAGINLANGEYIGFIDSDDFIAEDMFEQMYLNGKNFNVDIVSCGYIKTDSEGGIKSTHPFPFPLNQKIEHDSLVNLLSEAHKSQFIWYACRNIYSRSLLIDNQLKFIEGLKFAEDSIFNMYAFYYAHSSLALEGNYYFYRENPDSLTSRKGRSYLENSLIQQYEEKVKFYSKFKFDKRALLDLNNYVVEKHLPMLLDNAIQMADPRLQGKKLGEILNLRMISESLSEYKILNIKHLPFGKVVIILLSKLQFIILLKIFLNKIKSR